MRIRPPIAGAFCALLLFAAYLGFSKVQIAFINDKMLHFIVFFLLTLCFYWIIDTTRRRILNFTLVVMFGFLSFGSEFVQWLIPYRRFDPVDIVFNLLGCSSALGLCVWYHKRMLERKRIAKGGSGFGSGDVDYHMVGNEEAELGIIEEEEEEGDEDDGIGASSGEGTGVGGNAGVAAGK